MIVEQERSEEVASLLARVIAYDTSGGAFTLVDAMGSDCVYSVRNLCGHLVMAWTMNLHRDRKGVRAYVTACAGKGLTELLPHIERIARQHGANRLGFRTMRPGLVKKMERAGFVPRCVEMEKAL